MKPSLRIAASADYPAIADVIFDAIRNGPSRYTQAQREQWAPEPKSGAEWTARLNQQAIVVAETDGDIVGLMSLADEGYIDLAFIRPEAQGRGIFRLLFNEIDRLARDRDLSRLWVHASLMAQPAFAAVGFSIVEKQSVAIGDQWFDRFEMESIWSDPAVDNESMFP